MVLLLSPGSRIRLWLAVENSRFLPNRVTLRKRKILFPGERSGKLVRSGKEGGAEETEESAG